MQLLRYLRGSAGIQWQDGPKIRPCHRRPTQRRCSTPHLGAALPRSIVSTRDHHYKPGVSSSAPVQVGTHPRALAPRSVPLTAPAGEDSREAGTRAAAEALRSPWARGSTPASPAGRGMAEVLREREPLLSSASYLHGTARQCRASRACPG
ncbi:hypothetical protein NDU88_002653 [Pleurodeles waltl]|uniref:Uncharacterized protein n=1 Tax=Pleurodeles waltl TaxID=8319 RepID=A0AAV7NHQ4_PLEWA|nr:hypothetical protein NDU88_002653 [Pleurodeles waltl]